MRRSALRSAQLLTYDKFAGASGTHPKHSIAFLHGILGNKNNWKTPAKAFVQAMPDFVAVSVDHRGHGSSPADLDTPSTMHDCALEMRTLFTDSSFLSNIGFPQTHHAVHHPHDAHDKHQHGHKHGRGNEHADQAHHHVPTVLCGHSFGGKVALSYLKHSMEMGYALPAVTFILDAMPGLYPVQEDSKSHQQTVFQLMRVLQSAPETYESKKVALDYLSTKGIPADVVHWLATNLVPVGPNEAAVRYSFDINFIYRLFQDYCGTDMWDFLYEFNRKTHNVEAQSKHQSHHLGHATQAPSQNPSKIVFVRAGRNKAWSAETLKKFEDIQHGAHSLKERSHAGHQSTGHNHGNISLVTMPNVGHWLHVDDMQGLVDLLVSHTKQNVH